MRTATEPAPVIFNAEKFPKGLSDVGREFFFSLSGRAKRTRKCVPPKKKTKIDLIWCVEGEHRDPKRVDL